MNLNITPELYENISEIYETGNQSVVVVTNDSRTVKITARKVLRGPNANYVANYEQLVSQNVNGQCVRMWVEVHYPFAQGKTIEDCIKYAMWFVNNERIYL